MRVSPKLTIAFLIAVVGMWALAGYLHSKDEALAGVQPFLAGKVEVTTLSGEQPTVAVHKSVFYQGVPGKEGPYREYLVTAKGSRGAVDLTVRAMKPETENSWSYQVWAIHK